jgi:hypothetical protein
MWLRLVTAVAALVSAAVHLVLWFDGFRDIAVIGPAFLAFGFGASTLGAFVVSATVGLFGVREQWTGGWVLTAAVSEVVCIVGGLLLLLRTWPGRARD